MAIWLEMFLASSFKSRILAFLFSCYKCTCDINNHWPEAKSIPHLRLNTFHFQPTARFRIRIEFSATYKPFLFTFFFCTLAWDRSCRVESFVSMHFYVLLNSIFIDIYQKIRRTVHKMNCLIRMIPFGGKCPVLLYQWHLSRKTYVETNTNTHNL